ncbi:MAG TPA: DUF4339 domain-containing protein [Planctomicrobium sp.]|nr:DUF4339 domain-containing protein [Planctomicrobium sp.]
MKKYWFYQRDGVRHGPFSADDLRQKAANGELHPLDLVWREGMREPAEARFVPTLFTPQDSHGIVTDNGSGDRNDRS